MPRDPNTISLKGSVSDLRGELGKSKILETAYQHIAATGGPNISALSWDMDFTLHIHALPEENIVSPAIPQ